MFSVFPSLTFDMMCLICPIAAFAIIFHLDLHSYYISCEQSPKPMLVFFNQTLHRTYTLITSIFFYGGVLIHSID
ncbi:MAG: hypothetical protein J3R72DRAFT_446009 [Linnemannia gamsii]|nr:MAG: hypothetical protein J3R72DRAFT_446009 [Linnemannia gamsii]